MSQSSSTTTVRNNEISEAGQPLSGKTAKGIHVEASPDCVIANNEGHNNTNFGIYLLTRSTRDQFYATAAQYTRMAAGIRVYQSTGDTIASNLSPFRRPVRTVEARCSVARCWRRMASSMKTDGASTRRAALCIDRGSPGVPRLRGDGAGGSGASWRDAAPAPVAQLGSLTGERTCAPISPRIVSPPRSPGR